MGNAWNANKIDHSAAREGVDIDIVLKDGDGGEETWTFTIVYGGSGSSKRVAIARESIARRLKKQVGGLNQDQLAREVMAEAIIQSWSGITGPDGNEFPFTRENALTLFEEFPHIFDSLMGKATDPTVFQTAPEPAVVEEDSGN